MYILPELFSIDSFHWSIAVNQTSKSQQKITSVAVAVSTHGCKYMFFNTKSYYCPILLSGDTFLTRYRFILVYLYGPNRQKNYF